MKVLHVISGINPKSGGPTRSVKGLCRALSQTGVDVSLLVLSGAHPFEEPCGVKVFRGWVDDLSDFDIVHIHGLWLWPVHKVIRECRRQKVRYVISTRGMLDPWALSVKRWKKLVAMALYQRRDLAHAAALHATADEELRHIRVLGLTQPIIVAPNGVDLPGSMPRLEPIDDFKGNTAIFLSRLHPGKGLITLADAWAQIKPKGWRMMVVGPDSCGHKKDVIARLAMHGITGDWKFIDAVDDSIKWRYYRSADLLVHPSISENFGITIAEGLAAGLPVICTKGTPWTELEEHKCGWWIDVGVEPLVATLKVAMDLSDDERREMGERGMALVENKYTWAAVVKKMESGYEDILR